MDSRNREGVVLILVSGVLVLLVLVRGYFQNIVCNYLILFLIIVNFQIQYNHHL